MRNPKRNIRLQTQGQRKFIARANFKAFLASKRISAEFLEKKETKHATEASKATGIPLAKLAKTIVFVNEKGIPFVVIVRGDLEINRHSLQQVTGYKAITTAPQQIAEKTTGFQTGGIPPIGHRRKMPVFIDKSILELESVWCGGGSRTKLVKLKTQDIIQQNNATIAKFSIKIG